MDIEKLTANPREELGTRPVNKLREKGFIPAILYGHKVEPKPIAVLKDDLMILLRRGKHMVELQMDNSREHALIKDIQYDAFGDYVIHVDFARIAMDEKVSVAVPIELVGQPVGITHGGIMEHHLKAVKMECLPGDIPAEISLVVRELDVDARIQVKDLPQIQGAIYLDDPNEVVLHIQPPKGVEAEEEETAAGEAGTEPEVLTERKSEEEEKKPKKKK